jgi:hypothetical protein
MAQLCLDLALSEESLLQTWVLKAEELEGVLATESPMTNSIDPRHPSFAKKRDDLKATRNNVSGLEHQSRPRFKGS